MIFTNNYYNYCMKSAHFIDICSTGFQCGMCFAKERPESFAGMGYVGTLPDLTRGYESAEPKQIIPEMNPSKISTQKMN